MEASRQKFNLGEAQGDVKALVEKRLGSVTNGVRRRLLDLLQPGCIIASLRAA